MEEKEPKKAPVDLTGWLASEENQKKMFEVINVNEKQFSDIFKKPSADYELLKKPYNI